MIGNIDRGDGNNRSITSLGTFREPPIDIAELHEGIFWSHLYTEGVQAVLTQNAIAARDMFESLVLGKSFGTRLFFRVKGVWKRISSVFSCLLFECIFGF